MTKPKQSKSFPANHARHCIGAILSTNACMVYSDLIDSVRESYPHMQASEVRYGIAGLSRDKLIERSNDEGWRLTQLGHDQWRQEQDLAVVDQPAPQPAEQHPTTATVQPSYDAHQLTGVGIHRPASPADRLPMVYRDGALDASMLPRVHLGIREWPDGRREPITEKAA